jgi:hypothetical protein
MPSFVPGAGVPASDDDDLAAADTGRRQTSQATSSVAATAMPLRLADELAILTREADQNRSCLELTCCRLVAGMHGGIPNVWE